MLQEMKDALEKQNKKYLIKRPFNKYKHNRTFSLSFEEEQEIHIEQKAILVVDQNDTLLGFMNYKDFCLSSRDIKKNKKNQDFIIVKYEALQEKLKKQHCQPNIVGQSTRKSLEDIIYDIKDTCVTGYLWDADDICRVFNINRSRLTFARRLNLINYCKLGPKRKHLYHPLDILKIADYLYGGRLSPT